MGSEDDEAESGDEDVESEDEDAESGDEDAESVDPVEATEWIFSKVDADGDDFITLKELKAVLDAAKEAGEMTCAEKKVIIEYFKGQNDGKKVSKADLLAALATEIPEWLDFDMEDDEDSDADEEGEDADEDGEEESADEDGEDADEDGEDADEDGEDADEDGEDADEDGEDAVEGDEAETDD
jgi:hypothetical protein